ncbi:hypothetical protein JCM11251_002957 [Rhodosporidiobolus azoricus]
MPQATHTPPRPSLTRSTSSPTCTRSSFLSPLQLNAVRCIYIAHSNQAVQVSLRSDETDHDQLALARLYEEVEDDVTDLVAIVIHLSSLNQPLPLSFQFNGSDKGYLLTAERKPPSKALSRWVWMRDGVKVGQADYKLRFVFGRSGIGE